MIVIYGTRHYGVVDERGGEYALTRFAHIYWLPLFPVGSMWVTRTTEDGYRGHTIGLSGKSVLAGYARVWGPIAAVAGVFTGGVGGFAVAGAAAGLSGWSWTWRKLRGARNERRSHLNMLAFGTRCDPSRMSRELVEALMPEVEARWAEVAGGKTPSDVARFGAENPAQAVAAYGLLRLRARGGGGKASEDEAMRILDQAHDVSALDDGGPYRSQLPDGAV